MTAAKMKRIAVFRTCALGDAVQCTPLLQQIRADAPEARLTFFTSANAAPLLAGAPYVDEVVPLDPRWLTIPAGRRGMLRAWWEAARHGPFDALISLEATWLRNAGCLLVRAPLRAGLSFTGRRKPFEPFTHPLRITGDSRATTVHASLQYLRIWLGATGGEDRGFGYNMRHLLDESKRAREEAAPLALIAPGTGNAFLKVSTKQWPVASFAGLGEVLLQRGWRVAYVGGGDDMGGVPVPGGALNLLGKTTVRQAAQWIAKAAVLCGNDSGLFHLAQGLGCPALGIFGSTSPRLTGTFRAPAARTVQAALPCAGCYLHDCAPPAEVTALNLPRPCCMHSLTVARVLEELESLVPSAPHSQTV